MKTRLSTRCLTAALVAASFVAVAAGCSPDEDEPGAGNADESPTAESPTDDSPTTRAAETRALEDVDITVGSNDFDEQEILGQLTVQLLEHAGADVTDDTGSDDGVQAREKLVRGDIDVYWEYTGTGWLSYLGNESAIADTDEQYAAVAEQDLAENGVYWGPMAPFDNTYAFAVADEFSEENSVATHSDMATYLGEHPDSTVCLEVEFAARADGYPGFKQVYGISTGKEKGLDLGAIYTQTGNRTCDFGEVFTTDGRIAALGLTVLEDDAAYLPHYNGVPIAPNTFHEEHPEMMEVLAPLADSLTTEVMQELNAQVSVEGRSPEAVAEGYLEQARLTE